MGVWIRLTWQAAFSWTPSHRWRVIVLPMSAAVVGVLIAASASVLAWGTASEDRAASRRLVVAEGATSSATFYRPSLEFAEGRRIHVAWIAPTGRDDEAPLPPGVSEFPAPGQAFVSEALATLAATDATVAQMFPDTRTIGASGTVSGTELVAYMRPPFDRKLGNEDDALRLEGGRPVGEPSVVRVSGFGEEGLAPFADEQKPAWLAPTMVAIFGLLPAVVVLLTGMSVASRSRDHRLHLLHALGVPARWARLLGAGEAFLLAAPGVLIGMLVWQGMSRSSLMEALVPQALPGDLVAPPRLLALEMGVGATLVLWCALASTQLKGARTVSTAERTYASRLGVWLVLASALLFAGAALTDWGSGLPLRPVGSLVAVAASALMLPLVFAKAGGRLSESPKLRVSLVGRGMEYDPRRSAAPFLGVSAIVALGMLAGTFFSSAEAISRERGAYQPGQQYATVSWNEVRPQDLADFRKALGRSGVSATALQIQSSHQEGHEHEGGRHLLVGGSCEAMAEAGGIRCSADGLQGFFTRALGEPVVSVDFVPGADVSGSGEMVVFGDLPLVELDAAARVAARTTLPAARVDSDVFFQHPQLSSLYVMLLKGLVVTLLLLGIAALVSCVDSVRSDGARYARLWRLGASPRMIRLFAVGQFGIGLALAAGTGLVFGQIIWSQSTSLVQDGLVHGPTIAWLALALGAFGVVGGLTTYHVASASPALAPGARRP